MVEEPCQELVTLGWHTNGGGGGGRYTAAKQILDVTDWDRFLSFYSLILASLIG